MAAQPRTILQKLAGIPNRMQTEPGFAELLGVRARSATLGGSNSQAWKDYMMLIISNDPASLQLLRVTDLNAAPADVRESCAYMVGNGVCGAATGGQTGNNVKPSIDDGLQPEL